MAVYNRFTKGAQRALALSQKVARELGHNYVGTEHQLYGLAEEGQGAAAQILSQLGVTTDKILPVSYTHLDVYKRQQFALLQPRLYPTAARNKKSIDHQAAHQNQGDHRKDQRNALIDLFHYFTLLFRQRLVMVL